MSEPTVSVVMSVYNGAALVRSAINSILTQTYRDFELIVIDNGSFRDDTRAILHQIANETADARLRIVEIEHNIGLAGALNHGISLARGRYIARQDHDDVSRPHRLEQQVAYLDANPRCGLLGTRAEIWIGDTPTTRMHDHPTENAALQFDLLTNNPFVHSSVMIRKEVLEKVGTYTIDPTRQPPEDFELWSRIAREFEVANLPERLLIYREMPTSMSRDGSNPFLDKLLVICAENISWWAGLSGPDQACHDAAALTHGAYGRLSVEADIDAICARVESAGVAIAAHWPKTDITMRQIQAVANLRHHFTHARVLPAWTRPLVKLSRSLPLLSGLRSRARAWLSH